MCWKIVKKIFKILIHAFYAVSIISIVVLAVLNTTSVYKYVIYKYELQRYTGLSAEVLIDNYKRVINYVQNPFNKELVLNSLSMSDFGRIHFFEVKRIFLALYIFSIIFVLVMIIRIIINRNNDILRKILNSVNSSMNIAAIIFVSISAVALIDFPKAFYLFHKIFFRNDYWIFDPGLDPIINALPEELFMIEFALIISILIIFTGIIKVLDRKLKK